VTRLGAADGDFVTAGIYVFPERVRELSPPETVGRLREFLSWLVDSGEPVLGISIPEVVDVDRPEDVALAEALAAGRPLETALRSLGEGGAEAPRR
jgi:NDP-sugar pyrophosphorylase family protein